jgi:hypothetical protein
MSTQFNPDGTIPQSTQGYNPLAISSSTNATPIEITTGSSHMYATGDTVAIENHLVNIAANGLWTITVTAANKFQLNGSAGVGVGAATGYAIDYAVNPLFTLPADLVDSLNAASINPAIEGAANAIPYMYQRVGQYRTFNQMRVDHDDGNGTAWNSQSITSGSIWVTIGSIWWPYQWSFGRDIDVQGGDILLVDLSFVAQITTGGYVSGALIGLGADFDGGSPAIVPGTAQAITSIASGGLFQQFNMSCTLYASDFVVGPTHKLALTLMGKHNNGGSLNYVAVNPRHLNIVHLRRNQ